MSQAVRADGAASGPVRDNGAEHHEQRYQAVLEVDAGRPIVEVAEQFGVSDRRSIAMPIKPQSRREPREEAREARQGLDRRPAVTNTLCPAMHERSLGLRPLPRPRPGAASGMNSSSQDQEDLVQDRWYTPNPVWTVPVGHLLSR